MSKIKIPIIFFAVIAISITVFYTFYRDVHLLGGLNVKYDKEEVKQRAKILMQDLDISTKGLKVYAEMKSNNALIRQLQEVYGFKKGNKLLRDNLPGFYWNLNWQKVNEHQIIINSNSSNRNSSNKNQISVSYDNEGNLLQFKRNIPDSASLVTVSPQKAREIVKEFISKFGTIKNLSSDTTSPADTARVIKYSFISGSNEQYDFKIERKIELPNRTDYQYTWSGESSYIKDKIKLTVTVSGNIISNFNLEYVVPQKYEFDDAQLFKTTSPVIFYIIFFIMIAIIAYKKIKASEIGFRTAIFMGIVVSFMFALHLYSLLADELSWKIAIVFLIGPLFYGAGLFLTWAVTEAVTRETWKEKFLSIDLLSNGHFLHSKVGEGIFNGLSIGFIITVVWLIMLFIFQNFASIWSVSYDTELLSHFNSFNPALSILDKSIYSSIFLSAIFFNFIVSGLKRKLNSTISVILISAIIWGLVNQNNVHPLIYGILLEIVVGLILIWVYYKFDLFTTLLALISFNTLNIGLSLFTTGNSAYLQSGFIYIAIILLLTIIAFTALYTEDKLDDFSQITPAFVKNITERERLQRELEIARDVQMSFLPSENPNYPGLDVASRCVPALEVGGDYYDFVRLNGNKFGVIIGDVSGKGTQAAFYMTLTKGFLRALSKTSDSPSKVLMEMNSLFYENVERGTFISMIYAIFDMDNKIFRLARAGHNPVILKNSKQAEIEFLNPKGLALGLEKGVLFSKTIKEIEFSFSEGDTFVFYTDGFPEAMNKNRDEFGEDNLLKIINDNHFLNSEELLSQTFTHTKEFIGKAKQHDDMTMVVVKVKQF